MNGLQITGNTIIIVNPPIALPPLDKYKTAYTYNSDRIESALSSAAAIT